MTIVISSLTTIVPPVTEQKSPPASFITGADSPVIADSSTDANPFMTSHHLESFLLVYNNNVIFSKVSC